MAMKELPFDEDLPIVYWMVREGTVEVACPEHGDLDELKSLTVERFGHPRHLKDGYRVRFCRPCLEEYKDRPMASVEDDVKPLITREIERRWKDHQLPGGEDLGKYFEKGA